MLNVWARYLKHQSNLVGYIMRRVAAFLWKLKIFIFLVAAVAILILLANGVSIVPFYTSRGRRQSSAYCNAPRPVSGNEHKVHFVEEQFRNFQLKQLQIVIRHGDRAPILPAALPHVAPVSLPCSFISSKVEHQKRLDFYKQIAASGKIALQGDTMKTELIIEQDVCQKGRLSPIGILQHAYLGEHIQDSYKEFFHPTHLSITTDILVQATDYHRTIQSAASLLVGIFGKGILDVPSAVQINVKQDPYEDTHFLLNEKGDHLHCPALVAKLRNASDTQDAVLFRGSLLPLYERLAEVLLANRLTLPSLNRIVDVMYTRLCHDQGAPRGPNGPIPDDIIEEAFSFAHRFMTVKHGPVAELQTLALLSQIAMRTFIDIIGSSEGKLGDAERPHKFVVYSGHDSVLTPLLINMNAYDHRWPPYASRVIFEVYLKSSSDESSAESAVSKLLNTYVRVLYNGDVITSKLQFCKRTIVNGELCPVLDLYMYVSDGELTLDSLSDKLSGGFILRDFFRRIINICSE